MIVSNCSRFRQGQPISAHASSGLPHGTSLETQSAEQAAAYGLPPNKLNCTVILVAMDPSQNPATSWAAKMLSGLCLQQAPQRHLDPEGQPGGSH